MKYNNYSRKLILNMDESAIYLDAPSNYTYACKGSKRVKSGTSSAERVRLYTAFTASVNGSKLPIYAIIPRLSPIPEIRDIRIDIPHILPQYAKNSIFDSETIVDYLKKE